MDTTFIILVITVIVLIYFYLKKRHTYWATQGVPCIKPQFLYGNGEQILKGKISYGDQFRDLYEKFRSRGARHGGVYFLYSPVYIPLDPQIIKRVLQMNFDHFPNRGMYVNDKSDPLSAHLFNLEDTRWKNLRAKLTPTFTSGKIPKSYLIFTSGKMKMMFETLLECCNGFEQMLYQYESNEEPIDIKEIVARFTTDVIGSCAFGLECSSMKNPNSEFRRYGKRIFEVADSNKTKQILASLMPLALAKKIGISFTDKEVETFIIKTVKDTIAYREKNNVIRNDFLHLLIQLRNTGNVENDNFIAGSPANNNIHLTINEIAAQCFIFFAAGFETSSTTTTFALYELAINPDIQERLREEVLSSLEKHDNKITYQSVAEMIYLEKVLNETLRKYPPVPVLHRVCNKNYIMPLTNVIIEKGTSVQIPVLGLHYDPDYYPNPEIFDPERFSEENKNKRPGYTFLPFGDGPRICIGLRFGKLQTKLALITILRHYRVALNEKTKTPIKMDKNAFILSVEGGVWLNFLKL